MDKIKKMEVKFEQGDSKYFANSKKGEIYELKAELNSEKPQKRKDAVKKVIASMTLGKDVSSLFPDIINCMQAQADSLEMKKLVYLYVINYARSHPDMAILAISTFQKDAMDSNPLIRALAIRTMGCIRVEKITEYLCDPLRQCLRDDDPYVRKTAAVCVAKLFDINSKLVQDQGFLGGLQELLSDSNPMVVANAVAALLEIRDCSEGDVLQLTPAIVNKLLAALNECTEWGRVFIMDLLSTLEPQSSNDATSTCERISLRLQDNNAAVILSAIKVLLKYMEYCSDVTFQEQLVRKMGPPLVTLLSSYPEIQYMALRNISLIIQRRPEILQNEMKVFFVKYNDPVYVKMEKLDIMVRLASQQNVSQVLTELKEYSTEVDVDFVRKSVRSIGKCAIKIDSAAERCIQTLLDLIQSKVNYVVQEAIVVIRDIFRKYPNRYESIIGQLCENLNTLDEPEAKGAMIWIIGEYAPRIDNADELLASFVSGFQEEPANVQLQLLTASVKLFLRKPQGTQDLVQKVLALATRDSDNPDLRDRGYIYWRLLATDPAAAKAVVLADKPLISEVTDNYDASLLDELIANISTLSSVYHKPPSSFIDTRLASSRQRKLAPRRQAEQEEEDNEPIVKQPVRQVADTRPASTMSVLSDLQGDLLGLDLNDRPQDILGGTHLAGGLDDLVGGSMTQPSMPGVPADMYGSNPYGNYGQPSGSGGGGPVDDSELFNIAMPRGGYDYTSPKMSYLAAQQGKGMEISGRWSRANGKPVLDLEINNKSLQPLSGFAIQFNRNSFGLTPGNQVSFPPAIMPAMPVTVKIVINTTGAVQRTTPLNLLQVAVKNNVDVFYMDCTYPTHILFTEDGLMDTALYLQAWGQDLAEDKQTHHTLTGVTLTPEGVDLRLSANNIFVVAKRNIEGQDWWYLSVKYTNNIWVLMQLSMTPGSSQALLSPWSLTSVTLYLACFPIMADICMHNSAGVMNTEGDPFPPGTHIH
eukprot:Ihof_evm2s86 gene=Ihof_evmTU2s86